MGQQGRVQTALRKTVKIVRLLVFQTSQILPQMM